jgi:uncharacterized membrane protein YfcA
MLHPFLPVYFHWWHIPVTFIAVLIGESYGSLIGGGSIVTAPTLLFLGVPLRLVIATDNAGALGTEAGILSETWRKVIAKRKLVLWMILPVALGGIVGTSLLLSVSATFIKYLMVLSIVFILAHSYVAKNKPGSKTVSRSSYVLLFIFLFINGIYTNFIGLGEGTFGKIALMSVLGMTFIQSQGLKSAATAPIRLYSLVITVIAGLIVWPYLLTFWVASFIAGKYATRFVKKIPDNYARVTLTVMSIAFIAYLLAFY